MEWLGSQVHLPGPNFFQDFGLPFSEGFGQICKISEVFGRLRKLSEAFKDSKIMFRSLWETIAGGFSPQPVYTYPDSFENEGFWSVFKKRKERKKKNTCPRVTYLNGFSSST